MTLELDQLPGAPDLALEVLRFRLRKLVPFRAEELRIAAAPIERLAGQQEALRALVLLAAEVVCGAFEKAFAARGVRLGQITNASLARLDGLAAHGRPPGLAALASVEPMDPQGNALVLVPGNRQLDLKRLARALIAKRADLADPATAERLTGYRVGGISPFGIKQALPVVMDEGILDAEEILINAGRRGTMLKMSPLDVCAALDCILAVVSNRRDEKG